MGNTDDADGMDGMDFIWVKGADGVGYFDEGAILPFSCLMVWEIKLYVICWLIRHH